MKSKIEWTDTVWEPVKATNKETGGKGEFCIHASPGCENCYAEAWQPRFGNPIKYRARDKRKVDIGIDEVILQVPLTWRKTRLCFVCSRSDLFGEWVSERMIDQVFEVMEAATNTTFQMLTKRAERMQDYMARRYAKRPPPGNLWVGVSIESPAYLDRLRALRRAPAALRWVSYEPALEWVDFAPELAGLDWLVIGGESRPPSRPDARPMRVEWARMTRDALAAAEVPFNMKQWGEYCPFGQLPSPDVVERARRVQYVHGLPYYALGRKASGRLLDGVVHDELPGGFGSEREQRR